MMIGYTSNNSLNERDCFNPFKITAKHDDGGQGIISMVPFIIDPHLEQETFFQKD